MSIPQLPNELFLQIREFADFDTRLRMDAVMNKETVFAVTKRSVENSLFLFKKDWNFKVLEAEDGFHENRYVWIPFKRGQYVMIVQIEERDFDEWNRTWIVWLRKLTFPSGLPYFLGKEYARDESWDQAEEYYEAYHPFYTAIENELEFI